MTMSIFRLEMRRFPTIRPVRFWNRCSTGIGMAKKPIHLRRELGNFQKGLYGHKGLQTRDLLQWLRSPLGLLLRIWILGNKTVSKRRQSESDFSHCHFYSYFKFPASTCIEKFTTRSKGTNLLSPNSYEYCYRPISAWCLCFGDLKCWKEQ